MRGAGLATLGKIWKGWLEAYRAIKTLQEGAAEKRLESPGGGAARTFSVRGKPSRTLHEPHEDSWEKTGFNMKNRIKEICDGFGWTPAELGIL